MSKHAPHAAKNGWRVYQRTTDRLDADAEATGSLPARPDDEAAVLGSIVIAGSAGDASVMASAASQLRPEDFTHEAYRIVAEAAWALHEDGVPVDLLTLCDELERRGHLASIGGTSTVSALGQRVPNSYHVDHYAASVARVALRRRLIGVAGEIAAAAYLGDDANVAVERSRALVEGVADQSARGGHTTDDDFFTLDELLAEHLPDPRWVIPGILPEGLSLLAGKPKMGKSWFALDVALAVIHGGAALGQVPVERGEVLYLALEDTKRRLQSRSRRVIDGLRLPGAPGLTFRTRWPVLDSGGLAQLDRWLAAHETARLVIVDTLAKVRPKSDPNASVYAEDYAALVGLKRLADRHRVGILAIHHLRKAAAADPLDEISGSTGLTGASDGILVMRRERGKQDAVLHVTGRDVDERELALTFDAVRGAWTLTGDAEDYRRTQSQRAVLTALRDAGCSLSIKEVADLTGTKYDSIKLVLWRMAEAGEIRQMGRGVYAAPAAPATGAVGDTFATSATFDTNDTRDTETFAPVDTATSATTAGPSPPKVGKVSKVSSSFSDTDAAPAAPATGAEPAPDLDDEPCQYGSHEKYWRRGPEGRRVCPVCRPSTARRPRPPDALPP